MDNIYWVINPNSNLKLDESIIINDKEYSNTREANEAFLNYLGTEGTKITKSKIYSGMVKYSINKWNTDILKIIDIISYNSIEINLKLDSLNLDMWYLRYQDLNNIIKVIYSLIYNRPIDYVVMTHELNKNKDGYIFNYTPLYNENMIYVPGDSIRKHERDVNMYEYLGWKLLSTDKLTPFALSKFVKETNLTLLLNGSRSVNILSKQESSNINHGYDIFLVRSELPNVNFIVSNFEEYLKVLKKEGYLSIIPDTKTEEEIYPEVAHCWNTEVLRYNGVVILKSKINFNMNPEIWYKLAVNSVLSGNIPEFNLYLSNYVNTEFNLENTLNLRYKLIESYNKLKSEYKELMYDGSITFDVSNLSIKIKLYSYEQLRTFEKLIDGINLDEKINYIKGNVNLNNLITESTIKIGNSSIEKVEYLNEIYYVSNSDSIISTINTYIKQREKEMVDTRMDANTRMDGNYENIFQLMQLDLTEVLSYYDDNYNAGIIELKISDDNFLYPKDDSKLLYKSNGNYIIENMLNTEVFINYGEDLIIRKTISTSDDIESLKVIFNDKEKNIITGEGLSSWCKYIYNKYNKLSRTTLYI
jgi:hypothetical protein